MYGLKPVPFKKFSRTLQHVATLLPSNAIHLHLSSWLIFNFPMKLWPKHEGLVLPIWRSTIRCSLPPLSACTNRRSHAPIALPERLPGISGGVHLARSTLLGCFFSVRGEGLVRDRGARLLLQGFLGCPRTLRRD